MVEIKMQGPAKNALGSEMMRWIRARLREADGAPVLLTGDGDAFSAGLNLKELAGLDGAGMRAFLEELEGLVHDLYHHPGPTAAAVNGHAIAGGCVLALCCDVRVGTTHPGARMGLNEVALGLRFPPQTFAIVRSRLSRRHEETILLGAGLHDPASSLHLGLLDAVADDCVAEARARLAVLAAYPPDAYRAGKEMLRGSVGRPDAAAQREFLDQVLPVWTSPQLKERIQAFLGRR